MIILFLDDERLPSDVTWVQYPSDSIFRVVRNSSDFKLVYQELVTSGKDFAVSLDHDIQEFKSNGVEVTGYDVLKWMADTNFHVLPSALYVHSKNPIGARNIYSYWSNFIIHLETQHD